MMLTQKMSCATVVVTIRGHRVKINKRQAGLVTEKVIRQLKAEPKVIIPINSTLQRTSISRSDRNVPDISHVANNEECTTEDNSVYPDKRTNNQNLSEKGRNVDDTTINDIESELDKMFCLENDLSTVRKPETRRTHSIPSLNKPSHKNRRVQKQNLKELLIQLFGSPLEDLEAETYKPRKIQGSRRHTLPVSINCPKELLTPLKVSQKRSSVSAATSTTCQIQRKESSATICELPHIDFVTAKLLVKNETIAQQRIDVDVTGDLERAFVMERPQTGVGETVKCSLVIDLTGEDSDRYDLADLVIATASEEVKEEPSTSSERADVPAAPSMPLLSPVSPAQPTQQASLPENCTDATRRVVASSGRPPPTVHVRVLPSVPPRKRPYVEENPQGGARSSLSSVRLPAKRLAQAVAPAPVASVRPEQQNQQAPVQATPLSHSYFANLRALQADKTSKQAPSRRQSVEQSTTSTIPQSSSRIAMLQSLSTEHPNASRPQLQATVSSILHTAQLQASISQPQMPFGPRTFPPPYPGVQGQNSAPCQAPPLIRMFRPTHTPYEFQLISNAVCAEKLLSHVLTMARWRTSAIQFCGQVESFFTPNDFKQDYSVFSVYANQTQVNFGKKLIRDLLRVEVENFNLGEVCTVISRKLQEHNFSATNYKVCFNIHAMIKSCEEFCLTPFTKKFFQCVKTTVEKMEEKFQKSQQVLFTVSQLKQLELQIQQCVHIQRWLDCVLASSNRRPQLRPTSKKTHKKATEVLKQSLQNTMLKTMLHYQNVPDRSGPTRPELTPVIGDKQVGASDLENSQSVTVPVQVLVPQSNVPTESSAVVQQSPSREASVIVFNPSEETRPVENRTKAEHSQDEDIIDLTWIDDADESVMLEEITESKLFPCKMESDPESETAASSREVVSPADSGLGSPHSQSDEYFKCLCGKAAIYVCACKVSMYCGRECQINDWTDHQRWCQEKSS